MVSQSYLRVFLLFLACLIGFTQAAPVDTDPVVEDPPVDNSYTFSGKYYVESVSEKRLVGRPNIEDASLNPKSIILLPAGTKPSFLTELTFTGIHRGAGPAASYRIDSVGSYTTEINGRVVAVLQKTPPPTYWRITALPHQGKDYYIIENFNRTNGWAVDKPKTTTTHTPVLSRPLIANLSLPPYYALNQVFKITKVKA